MFFSLADNVYLVDGAVNSCIYDLARGKLYSISRDSSLLVKAGVAKTSLDKAFFERMLAAGLVIQGVQRNNKSILCLQQNPTITFAWVEVTNKCNLECVHCYENASPFQHNVMSETNFKYCINQLRDVGVKTVQIIGGEPLILGEKLIPCLEFAASNFDKVEVFTNGTLIDEQWVSVFKNFGIQIAVSIYSYIAREHDKVTGIQGAHQRACHGIDLLEKNKIPYRVASLKFKNVKLGKKTNQCYTLFNRKRSIVLAGRANLRLYNKSMLLAKMLTLRCFRKSISLESVSKMVSGHNCFSTRLYIDANMNVYPCVMEREFKHGNLLGNKLSDILNTEVFDLTKDKIKSCKECEFRYACMDCRPDRLGEDLYAKPWYCAYVPEEGKWLSKIKFLKTLEELQCA